MSTVSFEIVKSTFEYLKIPRSKKLLMFLNINFIIFERFYFIIFTWVT